MQKLFKRLAVANRKESQLIQGKIIKRVNESGLSRDLRVSMLKQMYRVSGHTDEDHIETLAEAYAR